MSKFSISEYVAPEKSNPWTEDVTELSTAVDGNEKLSATINLPGKTHQADLRAIRDAAAKLDRTVRILSVDESALTIDSVSEKGRKTFGGTYKITFTLRPKVADGRGRKPAEDKPKGK